MSAPQTDALVSLLSTVGTSHSIDLREWEGSAIRVTIWRKGEPATWLIDAAGTTREEG